MQINMQWSLMKNEGFFNSYVLADTPSDTPRSLLKRLWWSIWVLIHFSKQLWWYFSSQTGIQSRAKEAVVNSSCVWLRLYERWGRPILAGNVASKKGRMTHYAELSLCFCLWKVKENHTHTHTHRTTPYQCDLPTCHKHIITGLQLEHYNNKDRLDVLH